MALTPDQALAVQASRKLDVRYVERAGGWVAYLPTGARVRIPPQPGPGEAIEAADAHLTARAAQADRRDVMRLVEEMQRGRYFHRSRTIEEDDGAGGTVQIVVFDIVRASGTGAGSVTAITARRSVVIAWRDLVEALARGEVV